MNRGARIRSCAGRKPPSFLRRPAASVDSAGSEVHQSCMTRERRAAAVVLIGLAGCLLENEEGASVVLDPRNLACPDSDTQYRSAEGYCICDDEKRRFDMESGECAECEGRCAGRECGDDGCGRLCGRCEEGSVCQDGLCAVCTPNCEERECGPDGCGGSCGQCDAGANCDHGTCVGGCVPSCAGRSCGSDGCGGTCGTCASDEECTAANCVKPGIACFEPYVSCNCSPAPFGADLGFTRPEPACEAGYVLFDICVGNCYDPAGRWTGVPWAETCGC